MKDYQRKKQFERVPPLDFNQLLKVQSYNQEIKVQYSNMSSARTTAAPNKKDNNNKSNTNSPFFKRMKMA